MVLSPITEINLTSTIKDDLFMGNNNLPAAIGKTQTDAREKYSEKEAPRMIAKETIHRCSPMTGET